MVSKRALILAALLGALAVTSAELAMRALAGEPEVPAPPVSSEYETLPEAFTWEVLEFNQTIPLEWGTVFSINRVEKGGESYTFWFLAGDGTLRGVTTREFTGPNRASFFPEVYVIRRRWGVEALQPTPPPAPAGLPPAVPTGSP